MKQLLIGLFIGGLVAIGGLFAGLHYAPQTPAASTQSFGAFTPVESIPFTVAKTVLPTDNTITLSSFTTPDGRNLTMSNFGSIGYGTLDPNNLQRLESITFSGIVDNANGTVTLTGVTRGNDFISPYSASSTLSQIHLVGSNFILSNTAGFYGQQFLFANNTATSSATLVFGSTTPPTYDADPIWANFSTQVLADVSYVNSVVAAGAANASETVKGIVQLATATQAALGTATGSTGARLDLPASLATSTPTFQGTNVIPVTGTSNKLSQLFLDLTQTFNVSGLWNFSATTTMATSTVASTTATVANIGTLNVNTFNGQVVSYQDFLSSGTWTKPATASTSDIVEVMAWGGGGAGGSGSNGKGGGGGGACVQAQYRMSDLPSSITVTVGGTQSSAGGAGNNTIFGTLFTAYGGGGAGNNGANYGSGGGGGGAFSAGANGATDAGSGATGGKGGEPGGAAGGSSGGTSGTGNAGYGGPIVRINA